MKKLNVENTKNEEVELKRILFDIKIAERLYDHFDYINYVNRLLHILTYTTCKDLKNIIFNAIEKLKKTLENLENIQPSKKYDECDLKYINALIDCHTNQEKYLDDELYLIKELEIDELDELNDDYDNYENQQTIDTKKSLKFNRILKNRYVLRNMNTPVIY